jgi:hypothetical protein
MDACIFIDFLRFNGVVILNLVVDDMLVNKKIYVPTLLIS